MPPPPRPAVFLDRDDTLIANRDITAATPFPGDLFDPALVRLLPGVHAGLHALARAGFALVVVSNQGAVARGRCSTADVEATNARMLDLIAADNGALIDAVFYCPHHPSGSTPPFNTEHPWRKPAPGMILHAAAELNLDLSRSWMIGDAPRDIEAATRAGIAPERTILIGGRPDAADFAQAVQIILTDR
ncbi:MAG: D-glycero-alpha-D-manno-heptose-1,7-bisphosphate 7-phosphatase [Phycisphaerales bacterium]